MGHTAADDAEWHMKLKKNRTNQKTFYQIIELLKTYSSRHYFVYLLLPY
jgi:hypothetical protein